MIPLLLATALAQTPEPGCTRITTGDLLSVPPPAVIVLGERKGMQPDLVRAERIVSKLVDEAPVTLALEAVHRDHQGVLDAFAEGSVPAEELPEQLHFRELWGFDYTPYEPLVTASELGVTVVGVGMDQQPRPESEILPLPPGYILVLADALGGAQLPVELETRFVERVAWRDHAIARRAISEWSGEGYLVVLADRLHVEGGKGISWQAARLTSERVVAAMLTWADTPCYTGDWLLR